MLPQAKGTWRRIPQRIWSFDSRVLRQFEELREEFAQTKWNRILNVSVEGDGCIDRIKSICQIPKIFEDQSYYVLKSQEPEMVEAIKETLAKVGTRQSTGEY